MFNLIFTGVAPSISYFAMKFKFIFSIQFEQENSLYSEKKHAKYNKNGAKQIGNLMSSNFKQH